MCLDSTVAFSLSTASVTILCSISGIKIIRFPAELHYKLYVLSHRWSKFLNLPLVVGWSKAFEGIITGFGTGLWPSRRLKQHKLTCVVDYIRVHVDTHLQVRSLSSSWRSLQCSSVCLQEHRQVTGSCTNRRFLLSEQCSQHGSQTLDGETGAEVGGERERKRQITTVYSLILFIKRPPIGLPWHVLLFALPGHSGTSLLTG